MMKLNLQYFGGRGSSGSRSGGGGGSKTQITQQDWENWAVDPEPFQAALNGEPMPKYSGADGHEYTKEELDRARQIAPVLQEKAETSLANNITLFRGESYDSLSEARERYKVGSVIQNDRLTSYTTESDVADIYATTGAEFGKNSVKVVITNTNVNHSMNGSVGVHTDPLGVGGSAEVITPKGLKSTVMSAAYDKESNTLFVRMENTATPKKRK